jgi:signal transduction histidine kinase
MIMDARTRAAASITQAKNELECALTEIDSIRTFDPALIGLVAHALNNYITVSAATVEMLQLTLRGHPDPDVPLWLHGIAHTTDLMQHTVSRLVTMSAPHDFPLKLEHINVVLLMERACDYYRRRRTDAGIQITCGAVGAVPLARGDRVAIAVVADNLLSNAVRAARPNGTIQVKIMPEPGFVVCRVRNSGLGLTREEQERILQMSETGAGLAIATAFMGRMNGELIGGSDPGHGACFSFRLPAIE